MSRYIFVLFRPLFALILSSGGYFWKDLLCRSEEVSRVIITYDLQQAPCCACVWLLVTDGVGTDGIFSTTTTKKKQLKIKLISADFENNGNSTHYTKKR